MNILGVGPGELILILIITLVVVGPERLPDLARRGGQMLVRARNWMQSSPDAQMVLRMRQELEQELAMLRSSLSEVQSVRDEVMDAARQLNQTVGEDVVAPIKDGMREFQSAADTVSRTSQRNGRIDPAATEAPENGVAEAAELAPEGAETPEALMPGEEPAAVEPLVEPTIAPPELRAADLAASAAAPEAPEPTAIEELNARLETLLAELRATQEALRQRGLLDADWRPSNESETIAASKDNADVNV